MTRLHPSASFFDGLGFHSNRKDFLLLVPVGVLSAVTLAREMNCSGEEQQMTMAHSFQFEFLVPYYKFKKLKTEQDFVALKHCRDPKEEYEPHRLETDLSNTSLMSYPSNMLNALVEVAVVRGARSLREAHGPRECFQYACGQ